jgi:hypothetical protein
MTVYVVIDSSGYEGEHDIFIAGIYSTIDKAKEKFADRVSWAKFDIEELDGNWWFKEKETDFYAEESDRCSRNWIHIWIEEREVE